jgi:hypothetical protein
VAVPLRDLADLAELIGAVAVVLSLLYLAAQIRQNTRAVRGSTYQAGTDSVTSFMSLVVGHPTWPRCCCAARRAPSSSRPRGATASRHS